MLWLLERRQRVKKIFVRGVKKKYSPNREILILAEVRTRIKYNEICTEQLFFYSRKILSWQPDKIPEVSPCFSCFEHDFFSYLRKVNVKISSTPLCLCLVIYKFRLSLRKWKRESYYTRGKYDFYVKIFRQFFENYLKKSFAIRFLFDEF